MTRNQTQVAWRAAIHFTKSFYQNVFDGMKICRAFEEAKSDVVFKFKKHEGDLFKLMTPEGHVCVAFEKR